MVAIRPDTHLVLRVAAAEFFFLFLGSALHEDGEPLSDVGAVALERKAVLQGDNLLEPSGLHVQRHVIGVFASSEGTRALGVVEHIGRIEADGLEDGERICVVFFRFRAEAGNHIGGNRAVREDFADFGNAVQVPLTAVFAPHLLEYPVGA